MMAGLLACGLAASSPSRIGLIQWQLKGLTAYSCGGSTGIGDNSPHRFPYSPVNTGTIAHQRIDDLGLTQS